ncbi:MAG TPA: heme o synthase [Patescibacteria group bacterium]|nr:heme o synthase [Patescibacteria group bacterium]
MLKDYYYLTKPGIVYSNTANAIVGYIYGSNWHIHFAKLIYLILGAGLIVASSCVANNVLDVKIDSKMERTKTRAIITKKINKSEALIYSLVLGLLGILFLSFTSKLVLGICVFASLIYIFIYGYVKRISKFGTLVGTLPGSATLIAGYSLASGKLNVVTLLLFLIMLAWQMSHFYSIAIFRIEDYSKAKVPIWPIISGVRNTKLQIRFFITLFIVAILGLSIFKYNGIIFGLLMSLAGLYWLRESFKVNKNDQKWARHLFFLSLMELLFFMIMLPIGKLLP